MKANKSVKSSSDSRGGKAAAKPRTKRQAAKKSAARWKIDGDKVRFTSGVYSLADLKLILSMLRGES